jgi:hypothetical protein
MSKEKSRDLTATEAINKIKALEKVGEVRKFAKGDSRKTVNDAAESTIDKIKDAKSTKKEAKSEKKDEPKKEKKKTPSR